MRPARQLMITHVALCHKWLDTYGRKWHGVNISSLDILPLASECMSVQFLWLPLTTSFTGIAKRRLLLYVFVLTCHVDISYFRNTAHSQVQPCYRAVVGSVLHRSTCSKMAPYSQAVWEMVVSVLHLSIWTGACLEASYTSEHLWKRNTALTSSNVWDITKCLWRIEIGLRVIFFLEVSIIKNDLWLHLYLVYGRGEGSV